MSRSDFPILSREVHEKPLIYLDNAATTHKPQSVIRSVVEYYENFNSNVHRGAHLLSQVATDRFEGARRQVAQFLGRADREQEVVFTKGTTESINLVARSLGSLQIASGDLILVTQMEHHSNFVPWQRLAQEKGARIQVVDIDDQGRLDWIGLKELLAQKPKLLALTWMSNVLGTINPIEEIAQLAKKSGACVVIDGAQGVAHLDPARFSFENIDFFAFSGHKMFGPMGTGVLWGKEEWLKEIPPYEVGGGMVERVSEEQTTWAANPAKFEAGTPNVEGVIGLEAAIKYILNLGFDRIQSIENELTEYGLSELKKISGLTLFGPDESRGPVFSFELEKIHPHDLATFLDAHGIAVRAGHHCAQPLMKRLGVVATTRASFCVYNSREEVDELVSVLREAQKYFGEK